MNLNPLFKLSLISGALMLAACGGSDNNSSSNPADMGGDGHDHSATDRMLITSNNDTALTILELADEQFEALGQAGASSGTVIISDDGLSAAVVTNAGVDFVYSGIHPEEETAAESEGGEHSETHEAEILSDLAVSGMGLQVSMTKNHFAVLKDGDTLLYPAETLEEATDAEEIINLDSITQSFPAAILDEEHGLMLVFADGKGMVYEDETATETSFGCTSPAAVVHAGELTLAQCDEGIVAVVVEEEHEEPVATARIAAEVGAEPVIETELVAGLGDLTIAALLSNGHEGFVVGEGKELKALSWNHDTESVDVEDVALTTDATGICALDFASADDRIAILTNDGVVHFTDMEDNSVSGSVELDDASDSATCSDWKLAAGAEAYFVADSDTGTIYYMDSHEGSALHIHDKIDLPQGSDVSSMVLLHEKGEDTAHNHTHE